MYVHKNDYFSQKFAVKLILWRRNMDLSKCVEWTSGAKARAKNFLHCRESSAWFGRLLDFIRNLVVWRWLPFFLANARKSFGDETHPVIKPIRCFAIFYKWTAYNEDVEGSGECGEFLS